MTKDQFIKYSKNNPFRASIKERYSLCKPGSQKNTQHITLDLSGSGIHYEVGDSVAIFPQNDPKVVNATLQALNATGFELVHDKRQEQVWPLREFLTFQANITEAQKQLLSHLVSRQSNLCKKNQLEALFEPTNREALDLYLEAHDVWEILIEHSEVKLEPQELCSLLQPMLPRFYSVASSRHAVGEEIHLTVALRKRFVNGKERMGVCTHYLCNLAPIGVPAIPLYIQPHRGFTLPENPHAPLIMIGPGTGVAPFRAFIQERILRNAPGKNWLFFGECNRSTDFFYEEVWMELVTQERLRLAVAFSRDQEEKVYVQHRMWEHSEELFQWLEEGAHLFVCGDAKYMAKDVEAMLLQIIQTHAQKEPASAKEYLKRLRTEKRYLRDVY